MFFILGMVDSMRILNDANYFKWGLRKNYLAKLSKMLIEYQGLQSIVCGECGWRMLMRIV